MRLGGGIRHAELGMKLWVNGEERAFEAAPHVAALIAVERNLEIVPRSVYEVTPLNEGDHIEIVHFIGGG